MTTYVVGVDGSEHARDALEWAAAVATERRPRSSPCTRGRSRSSPATRRCRRRHDGGRAGGQGVPDVDAHRPERPAYRRPARHRPSRAGAHRGRRRPGRRTRSIVVGHGGSSKAALLLGSTANYVIHHTKAPVVVVRGACRVPVRRVVVGDRRPASPRHPTRRRSPPCAGPSSCRASSGSRCTTSAFVPDVVAGPLSQPGGESDDAEQQDAGCCARRSPSPPAAPATPPTGPRWSP